MMKHEFEQIAGYEVTMEDYNKIIEPMYMATNLSKEEFVKVIDKKRFALPTKEQMVREMRKIAKNIFEHCGQRCFSDEEQEIRSLARKYAERFFGFNYEDTEDWYWIKTGKAYCGYRQDWGCSFPEAIQIGRGNSIYAEITLVK